MACNITGGFVLDCTDGIGGVEALYIMNGATTWTETGGLVSAITDGTTQLNFFEYPLKRQTAVLNETDNVDFANGTLFYNQDLTITFDKLEVAKRNEILLMAKNNDMAVVVKDNNGAYWTVGAETGAHVTASAKTTGTGYGDKNGYTLTISGTTKVPMYEVQVAALGNITLAA